VQRFQQRQRRSGAVKVPPELHGDRLVPAIRAAAVPFVMAGVRAVYEAQVGARE
jgi:hypothetical protein